MKRNVILTFLISVMVACLGGCILSTDPAADSTITLKVGEPQTFTVSGFFNNAYTWTKGSDTVATGESYTYTAAAEDIGTFTIKVQTTELFSTTPIVKEWTMVVTDNLPPTAIAGGDQNVAPNAVVQLDGSASADPEGDSLTYLWEIVARPDGSNAALDANNIAKPSFTPDVEGAYTIRLTVNDGNSNASDVVVVQAYTDNVPPTADAGADQEVLFGSVAQLNGTASSDMGGGTLTYRWSIDSGPAGTAATLDDPTSATPTFTPDRKGQYVVRLVVNDGRLDSNVDWVVITVYNHAPKANAGTDTVYDNLGDVAELDGSDSADPDGTTLTYAWTIVNKPIGSAAVLVNPTSENPTLTLDKKGAYVVKLVVSDGDLTSEDTVMITCSNQVPVANAGSDFSLPFGGTVQLNGYLSSDPDGDALTYAWSVFSRPVGSAATLSNATIVNPTFTPDKKGTYVFELIVTDSDGLGSAPDYVTVVTTNNAPVANAGGDINLVFPRTIPLNGSGTDLDGDLLTYQWTLVTGPGGSTADLLSDPASATPIFTPAAKGDYTFQLVVNDGEDNSNADTVLVHVYNTAPSAEAGANISQLFGTTAQLDGSASYDNDADTTLSYAWTIVSGPGTATITNPNTVNPTFKPNAEGTYVIMLTVSDGDLTSSDTLTLTTFNYNQGWENGMGTWEITTATNTGGMGTIGIVSNNKHSGSYSFDVDSVLASVSNTTIVTTPINAYVTTVSLWQYWDPGAFGGSSIDTDLLIDGALFVHTSPNQSPTMSKRTWTLRGPYTVNRYVTTLAFACYNFLGVGADEMYFDDIVINCSE